MSKKSSSTSGPSKFAQPYISAAAGAVTDSYNQNKGAVGDIAHSVQSLIPSLMDKYNQGNPTLNAANTYSQGVLHGDYLNNNPYIDAIANKTGNDVTDRVNAAAGSRGSFGGSAWQGNLTRNLADSENTLRYGNYQGERANQQQAMSAAPQMAAADYMGITPLLATAEQGASLPFTASNNYAQNIGNLLGSSQTTTSKAPIGASLLGGIGSLMSGAAALSDSRLKRDIEKLGEFADGLGKYAWTYVWGGPRHVGVMADEVKVLRPWALGPEIAGYMTVNYGAL